VLTSGTVLGVMDVVLAAGFAAFVFSGPLGVHLPAGVGLSLFSAASIMLIVSLLSGFPSSVASVQDVTAAVLGVTAAAIAARVGEGDDVFLTVVLALTLTTAFAGVTFLVLGGFRLGALIRFVPYPVVGGFLAGTGWLLAIGALGVLAGRSLTLSTAGEFGSADLVVRWLPGVAFGTFLLLLTRKVQHFLAIPAAILGAAALFFATLAATGTSVPEAEAGGWLLGPLPSESLWRPWSLEALAAADWGAIVSQALGIATVALLAVVTMLLNVSGIELAADEDVDPNRELRAAGAANVVAGLGGGLPGFHALSLTMLAHRTGARSRATGLLGAAIIGTALIFGARILGFFPRAVLGGLLFFLGISFLVEWVIDARERLPRSEHLVVLLILAVIAAFGFLQGVGVGLLVAVAMFVVRYSRTDMVKHEMSGVAHGSNVDRSANHREILRQDDEAIHVMELQGFVFFGTASGLLDRVRQRIADTERPLRFLILVFRRVTGLDSSAVLAFGRVLKLASAERFRVVMTDLAPEVERQLAAGLEEWSDVLLLPDLDFGLEHCEDRILEAAGATPKEEAGSMRDLLRAGMGDSFDVDAFLRFLDRVEVGVGEAVMRQGEAPDDLYFLESGRLTVRMTRHGEDSIRLRTMGPGTVVGELAAYLGTVRTASVVAEEPSVLYRLSRGSLARLEEEAPALAAGFHRFMARLLADRLFDTLQSLKSFMD
jgi:SulP family sulfate permease